MLGANRIGKRFSHTPCVYVKRAHYHLHHHHIMFAVTHHHHERPDGANCLWTAPRNYYVALDFAHTSHMSGVARCVGHIWCFIVRVIKDKIDFCQPVNRALQRRFMKRAKKLYPDCTPALLNDNNNHHQQHELRFAIWTSLHNFTHSLLARKMYRYNIFIPPTVTQWSFSIIYYICTEDYLYLSVECEAAPS